MTRSSSADLHPATGARFVFERAAEEPPTYRVAVYLPGGRAERCTLRWSATGAPLFEPAPTDEAVLGELVKLSRVLHREPKARLVRWREL